LPNDLGLILKEFSAYRSELEGIVVESTYNWYWLVDGLMEQGYKVHLANTAAIQQYNGLKYTDDNSDARWLAHLLRLGVLPEGYIYPKQERAVRDLQRAIEGNLLPLRGVRCSRNVVDAGKYNPN
jgi:transposase